MRKTIRIAAAIFLIVSAYWNILDFWKRSLESVQVRESNDVVAQRNRFEGILQLLRENGYLNGTLGFVASEWTGRPKTSEDDANFWRAQYVAFPFILARNAPDAPYVVVDSSQGPVSNVPDNLVQLGDMRNGLILYRQVSTPLPKERSAVR